MDRQTLRDWVHRFNRSGPEGLIDNWTEGPKPRLSPEQLAEFARSSRRGPTARSMASCAGGGSTSSASSSRDSASTITSAMSESCSRSSAFRTSARDRATRRRTNGSSRRLKKLPARLERPSRRVAGDDADRNLVSGRSPHRPEERPGAAMGQARNAASPASRPALRQRLSVRRHLPGARGRRGACVALCRHRHDAASSRRNLTQRRRRRPRRAAARPRRMAHDRQARRPRQHHPDLLAFPRARTEPGRERLAVLRSNWLSNLVFDNYDEIIDAACDAWRKLIADPKRSPPSECECGRMSVTAMTLGISRYNLDWSVVYIGEFYVYPNKMRAGLQLSDIVASAFYSGLERTASGKVNPEFAKLLLPRIARGPRNCILGTGVKFMPRWLPGTLRPIKQRSSTSMPPDKRAAVPGPSLR